MSPGRIAFLAIMLSGIVGCPSFLGIEEGRLLVEPREADGAVAVPAPRGEAGDSTDAQDAASRDGRASTVDASDDADSCGVTGVACDYEPVDDCTARDTSFRCIFLGVPTKGKPGACIRSLIARESCGGDRQCTSPAMKCLYALGICLLPEEVPCVCGRSDRDGACGPP